MPGPNHTQPSPQGGRGALLLKILKQAGIERNGLIWSPLQFELSGACQEQAFYRLKSGKLPASLNRRRWPPSLHSQITLLQNSERLWTPNFM